VSSMRYGLTRQSYDDTGVQNTAYVTLRSLDFLYPQTRPISAPSRPITSPTTSLGTKARTRWRSARIIATRPAARLNFANSFSDGYINSSWLQGTGTNLLVADAKNSTLYTRLMTEPAGHRGTGRREI